MFRVTEMFACRISSCTTFTSSPFPLRSVAYVSRNVCQPKMAHDSDFFRRWLQVRLVQRTRGSLAADPPENPSTTRPQGRDTRHADRKIVALSDIRSRRVGAFEVKVSQLSVPSLTTEDRDETDEISARQPSDREACRWPEGLGVPMVRPPGRWQSDATQSNGWIARTISERDGGSEGRRRTSGRHQR